MKLRRLRNDLWFALCFMALTLAWGIIGLPWGFAPAISGFGGLGWNSDVEMIHSQFPGFLLDPATFEGGVHDIFMPWLVAELKLRLALVAGSWLLVAAMLWRLDWRSRRSEVRRITTWTPR